MAFRCYLVGNETIVHAGQETVAEMSIFPMDLHGIPRTRTVCSCCHGRADLNLPICDVVPKASGRRLKGLVLCFLD